MKVEFSPYIFEKSSGIKFHEKSSSGSLVVPCGQTDRPQLIVVFLSFANSLKKSHINEIPVYY